MFRSHDFQRTNSISYKYLPLASLLTSRIFPWIVFFHLQHFAGCQKYHMSIISRVYRLLKKLHGTIFQSHMKKAFHLSHRIFFYLLRRSAASQSEFCLYQHGNKLSRSCLMGRPDCAVFFQHRRICGPAPISRIAREVLFPVWSTLQEMP